MDEAIALAPEHLSLYMLEVYPNAPLREDMARAAWSQAPDDDVAAMYMTAMERLEGGRLSAIRDLERRAPGPALAPQPQILDRRRVVRFWLRRAFDASAASAGKMCRRLTIMSPGFRRGRPPAVESRRMTADERLGDALFTGLRLSEGADIAAINERYGVDVWARYGPDLESVRRGRAVCEVTDCRGG